MADLNLQDDVIDVRDIIARFEELEARDDALEPYEVDEIAELRDLLRDLRGYGGDEQWRGDWYPITLIDDVYFEDYARELAEDLYGDALGRAVWPFTCIDWQQAAQDLRQDYTSVDVAGRPYWYR